MSGDVYSGRRAREYTAAVLQHYGTDCHLCTDRSKPATTADHVVPRSKGGDVFALDNGRPAHQRCNSRRGAMPLDEWFRRHPPSRTPLGPLPPSRDWSNR